jgi:hypothetical protein
MISPIVSVPGPIQSAIYYNSISQICNSITQREWLMSDFLDLDPIVVLY